MDTDSITIKRIFISHSRKDSVFGDAIVKLLRGIGLTQNQIIYTSDPSYGIPPGQNIFNYLRDQIRARQKKLCKSRQAVVKKTGANQGLGRVGHSLA